MEKEWLVVVGPANQVGTKGYGKFDEAPAMELQAMYAYAEINTVRAYHLTKVSQYTNHVVINEDERKRIERNAGSAVWQYYMEKNDITEWDEKLLDVTHELADEIAIQDRDYVFNLLNFSLLTFFPEQMKESISQFIMPSGSSVAESSMLDIGTDFHAHLDECTQCRENPMGLCAAGQQLLTAVASKVDGKNYLPFLTH